MSTWKNSLLWILLLAFASPGVANAQMNSEQFRKVIGARQSTQAMCEAIKQSPLKVRSNIREKLKIRGQLPENKSQADRYMDQVMTVVKEYCTYVSSGGAIQNDDVLKRTLYDEKMYAPIRQFAGFLLYIKHGHIVIAEQILEVNPNAIGLYTELQDDSFGDIMRVLFAKAKYQAAIQDVEPGEDTKLRALYAAKAIYPKIVDVITFQKHVKASVIEYIFSSINAFNPFVDIGGPSPSYDILKLEKDILKSHDDEMQMILIRTIIRMNLTNYAQALIAHYPQLRPMFSNEMQKQIEQVKNILKAHNSVHIPKKHS